MTIFAPAQLKLVVDIGGTKTLTKCYLEGEEICEDLHVTDHSQNEIEQLDVRINDTVKKLETFNLPSNIETEIIVSSAGMTPKNRGSFDAYFISFPLQHKALNITKITYENDGALPLALHPLFNLSIVAGTGSNIFTKAPDGKLKEHGRFDTFRDANQGSGFKIGYNSIKALTDPTFHTNNEEGETLLQIVKARFGNTPLNSLLVGENSTAELCPAFRQTVASIAASIIAEASKGNTIAAKIIHEESNTFARTIHQKLTGEYPNGTEITAVLTGSIVNSHQVKTELETALTELGKKSNYTYSFYYNTLKLPYSGFQP